MRTPATAARRAVQVSFLTDHYCCIMRSSKLENVRAKPWQRQVLWKENPRSEPLRGRVLTRQGQQAFPPGSLCPVLLSSRLYCRFRNHTESAFQGRFADYTAGRESHPAPKNLFCWGYYSPGKRGCQERISFILFTDIPSPFPKSALYTT